MENSSEEPNEAHTSPRPDNFPRSSPAPQKRARDYGKELKGLSPSGDEGSPSEQSPPTPTFKRRKISNNIAGDVGGGSDSEGLDDGEIVESPVPSPVAQLVGIEKLSPDDMRPQTLNTSNSPISVSSDDGEIIIPSRAEERSSQTRDIKEEGDFEESQETENASSAINNHSQGSLPSWNRGIQLGTRTTFGTKPANAFFEKPSATPETMKENQEQQDKKEKKQVRSRDPVSTFEACNATWKFPLNAPEITVPENASEQSGFWPELLKKWIGYLLQANGETADRMTYKVVRSGWPLYFTRRMGFLQGTRKQIIATRGVAQTFMASLNKKKIDTMIADARQKRSASQPDNNISATVSSRLDHEEELRLQAKYFPGADEPSQYCLSCSGIGHTMQDCPELTCRFCESKSHASFGCPTRRRCDKCRQIGHSVDACQEKLSLAADELDGCAFCGADHQDRECFEIWRSFKPSELNMKKVKSIPAFCYVCGGENHFGPECSLSGNAGKVTDDTTWSKANRDLYTDIESEDVAIAWSDVNLSEPAREFHIPGRATRTSHTYFVSSDESEEDLIHAPVKKPQNRVEIRIASNIGTTNGNSLGRGGGYRNNWQPPLPAGPPPPPADRGSKKPFQSAPSGTLPPRPQTIPHGKPPGRGRGWYRGRGRGRGRGK
ncbi:hypothetical protein GGS24DRAFT_280139 [Hypoxylon argillaceum]|nr:hypothetical protein GGS24DRAFT_280139 [Hypoxylon argillaceum]